MPTQIFVNLPVKDLGRSIEFFSSLGYTFDKRFTDENATCMIVDETIFVMLLVEKFFKTFTKKELCDAKRATEAIVCLSVESRSKVDEIVRKAKAAGAVGQGAPTDYGFMYLDGFEDLDGHLWEIIHMDPDGMVKN